jgi:hypothetical protein
VGLPHLQPAALDPPEKTQHYTSRHLKENLNSEEKRYNLSKSQVNNSGNSHPIYNLSLHRGFFTPSFQVCECATNKALTDVPIDARLVWLDFSAGGQLLQPPTGRGRFLSICVVPQKFAKHFCRIFISPNCG